MSLPELVVIGCSAGGIDALMHVLPVIPKKNNVAIVIVQHQSEDMESKVLQVIDSCCQANVVEATINEKIKTGSIYVAPPGYHLLIENDGCFSLSCDERVNYVRPSVDVLIESAADAFTEKLTVIILTGANSDGAKSAKYAKDKGAFLVVQDPSEAYASAMPSAVLSVTPVDLCLRLNEIKLFLTNKCENKWTH